MTELSRRIIRHASTPNEQAAAIECILKQLGYYLIEYQEPGEEVETSHGRSYYSEGKKSYCLEKRTVEEALYD